MRPVLGGEVMRPGAAQRDLDPLYGVHDMQAQLAVENIEGDGVVKARAISERMVAIGLGGGFKGQPIGPQPVIADMAQIVLCPRAVRHSHAASLDQRDLVSDGKGGFGELHARPAFNENKALKRRNPPGCAVRSRNFVRGVAGLITSIYGPARLTWQ